MAYQINKIKDEILVIDNVVPESFQNAIVNRIQGDQHFHPVPRWGGLHGHLSTAKHDQIKALYAIRKNIPLFYITESEQNKIYPILEGLMNFIFSKQLN